MGRSNPWGDLDQMSLVGRYRGRNHVCYIWWLSVKGCGCGEKGKFAFSHWLDASPLQHWSHYRVTVWCWWACDDVDDNDDVVLNGEASCTFQLTVMPRTARTQRCRCFRAIKLTSSLDLDALAVSYVRFTTTNDYKLYQVALLLQRGRAILCVRQ